MAFSAPAWGTKLSNGPIAPAMFSPKGGSLDSSHWGVRLLFARDCNESATTANAQTTTSNPTEKEPTSSRRPVQRAIAPFGRVQLLRIGSRLQSTTDPLSNSPKMDYMPKLDKALIFQGGGGGDKTGNFTGYRNLDGDSRTLL
ncbi:MAG: hypothetical protein AMXMBFR19_12870 [Chthonomonadaceae bacterium]